MQVADNDVRIVTVRVKVQAIADDGMFLCDVNPLHDQARWMSVIGEHVHIALCDECKRQFETAVVPEEK